MKKSEIIAQHYDTLRNTMADLYRDVVQHNARIQYELYIWEDGEIETLCAPNGNTSWLDTNPMETREPFYVCTIAESPCFSLSDYVDDETDEETAIDGLVSAYLFNMADNVLYAAIKEAERDERYAE